MSHPAYAVIEFMESNGLVPVVQKLLAWDEIPLSQLRVPAERTDDVYYLRVIDGIIEAVYKKHEVVWKHA